MNDHPMDDHQQHGVSRRSLVKSGFCALAGIAIVSITGTKTLAAEAKLQKSAVQYEDVSKRKDADCDDCVQFIPGKTEKAVGTCKIVDGEINPHGHCIAFTPKPRKSRLVSDATRFLPRALRRFAGKTNQADVQIQRQGTTGLAIACEAVGTMRSERPRR